MLISLIVLGLTVAAESAVVALSDNVTLIVCKPPRIVRGEMVPARLAWQVSEASPDGNSVKLVATFPGEIDGRKFQLLETTVTDSSIYKFELDPTLAFESPSDPAQLWLSAAFEVQRNAASKVNFDFTYYNAGKGCPDEKFIYSVNAKEGLTRADLVGH